MMAEQASLGPIKSDLYEAVTSLLNSALQPDNELQKKANLRLQRIEVIEEYPLVLCRIIGAEGETISLRHIASVFLKKYLEDLFSKRKKNLKFVGSDKSRFVIIKLMDYMSSKHSKLTEMVSCSIALLLGMGLWHSVARLLNDMIISEDPHQMEIAICILYKAIDTRFLENTDYVTIDYNLFDLLLAVLSMNNISSDIRVNTLRPMFLLMKYLRPSPNYITDCLTRFSEEIEKILNEPYSTNSDYGLKGEILKCLNCCIDEFYNHNNIFIPPMLPIIGSLLTVCCEQYKNIIRGTEKPPIDSGENDEEPKRFFGFINELLRFIFSLIDMTYFEVLIEDWDKLIYCIYIFMAFHDDRNQNDNFIDKNYWPLREICGHIITYSLEKIESRLRNGKAIYFKSMHNVFQKFNREMDFQQTNDPHEVYFMSCVTESMIFGASLIKEKYMPEDEIVFPLKHYLTYWTSLLDQCNIMLRGRILWIGGIYCTQLNPNVMECHLNLIIPNLEEENQYLLIPSGEALCNYLKEFRNMVRDKQFIITRSAKQIMDVLIKISKKSSDFPLHQSLNALGYLVKSHTDAAKQNIDAIENLLIQTIISNFKDPSVINEVLFICAKLAQSQGFNVLVHDKLINFLENLINNLEPREMQHDLDKAFDILNTICLYSPLLDEYLILETFLGAARRLMLNTERDIEIDVSAGNLLTTLIVKVPNKINLISYSEFPRLLEMLIQPDIDLPRNILGKLVITTMFSLPEIMRSHHETILRNVITGSAKNNSKTIRSNWIIFIFICMLQTNDAIRYLSFIPGPSGGSALNFIIRLWHPEYFLGVDPIEKKIIVLSIVRILQYCFENHMEYEMMVDLSIPFDIHDQETSSDDTFNGIEYLYYLLIQCLLYENLEPRVRCPSSESYDFSDFAEDPTKRHKEDEIFLYYSHPFNIDIVEHIIHFLKNSTEAYFNVIRRFVPEVDYFTLKELGCVLPEHGINVLEAME